MRNTPVKHIKKFTSMRTNQIEYDSTSVIPSIAAMSMRGIIDPRLKHNNGNLVDLNVANDPVELGKIANGVRSTAEKIDAANRATHDNPPVVSTAEPEPANPVSE